MRESGVTGGAMSERTAGRLAWTICGLAVAAMVADPVLFFVTPQAELAQRFRQTGADVVDELANLGLPLIGAVIASRRPKNPLGWLLIAAGAGIAISNFGYAYTVYATEVEGAVLPGAAVLDWLSAWCWSFAFASLPLLLLLFPTGKLHSRRWRPLLWAALAFSSLLIVGACVAATFAALTSNVPLADESSAFEDPRVERIFTVMFVVLFIVAVLTVAALVATLMRFHSSRGEERLQLRWFALAASVFVGVIILEQFVEEAWVSVAFLFASVGLYCAIAIAILKYRLYDIEVVIRKTVVYSILAVLLLVLGFGSVAIVTRVFASTAGTRLDLMAGVLIGLAFWPLRSVAARIADRLVFGGRASPYEVLTTFSGRVGEAYAADDVLPRMAQVLAMGIGADRATIWLRVGADLRPAAHWPTGAAERPAVALDRNRIPPLEDDHAVEIRDHDELLGALSVTMPASDPMNSSKERLVDDLASQARLVLRSVRLIEELRASRQRLVAAQDDERHKIERNIHDGAQQQLVALAVKLRLTEQVAERDAARTKELLAQLQTDATGALEDLRDLARGIYPPLLADQGLAAALEAQARRAVFPVAVEPDGIGRFSRQVESAVYFSVLEALQNVAKYADASAVTVHLSSDDVRLTFRVTDDGRGFDPASTTNGTGLQGIADRLASLNGELDVRSAPGSGTTVMGHVPVGGAA
jgi:signal transduction histidine kinase